MNIAIDLNTIRNINPRVLASYQDGICRDFDIPEDNLINDFDINKNLVFENDGKKTAFFHEDYAYEIYGCSNPFSSNLPRDIDSWIKKIDKKNKAITCFGKLFKREKKISLTIFDIKASDLILQASLFFLSKIPCRIRNIIFPTNSDMLFKKFSYIITSNPYLMRDAKKCKKIILIKHEYNKEFEKKCKLAYNSFEELLNDNEFFKKI